MSEPSNLPLLLISVPCYGICVLLFSKSQPPQGRHELCTWGLAGMSHKANPRIDGLMFLDVSFCSGKFVSRCC